MMEVERPALELKEEQQPQLLNLMDAEEEEEDTSVLLHTRDRNGKKKEMADLQQEPSDSDSSSDSHSDSDAAAAAAAAAEEGKAPHHQSIFLDPTKVSGHATELGAGNQVTEVGGQKENANETSGEQGKEIEKLDNVSAQETNHSSSNDKLENGTHSNGVHEISSSSETVTVADGLKLITAIRDARHILPNWSGSVDFSSASMSTSEVHEIEVEKDETVTKGEVKVEEYDLQKILNEQETHDLYCPNCNSCITRRVILKKRKRTVSPDACKEPRKRPQPEPIDPPDVFRCLSCLTFFIPTGCNFNIFRIFGTRDVDPQVLQPSTSQQTSENCGSWLLSCFQTADSPKPPNTAGSLEEPLLSNSLRTDPLTSVEGNIPAEQSKKPSPVSTVVTGSTEIDVVTIQQKGPRPEPIPLSHPPSDTATDPTHLGHEQDILGSMTAPSVKPVFIVPIKVLPGEDNQTPVPVEPEASPHTIVTFTEDETPVPALPVPRDEWDILKAIVYGGLVESIMSLSVVSAAAASGSKTLDIFILGIANLIGGLPVIYHNIADLRNTGDVAESSEQVGHYWLELGRRSKYQLHMVIAILSYILFGLLPPVIYGFSFRTSDNRENKMLVVAAVSLLCIALLAIGKAHVKRPRTYFTTLLYYLSIGFSGSGLSYVAGVLITKLLAHFGIIEQSGASAPAPPGLSFPEAAAWASY